jgi:lysine 6-dehydrogenase
LGAGRQGTAAGYDFARHGEAAQVVMADADPAQAQRSAARINALVGREVAVPAVLDASDGEALRRLLEPADGVLSAVPYFFNLEITRAAVASRTHMTDIGGHTATVFAQLALDEQARQAGISIVPDCGMGPGLINTIGAYLVEAFDEPREVHIYDGGLPQHPEPPWNYALTFHINGLTNEYDGTTTLLIDGELTEVEGLTQYERLEIPPLGELEAFITTGGASTAPWTFHGRLQTYINKTLRYPGHYEWFLAYKTLGLFSETPMQVSGCTLKPRDFYHALLAPKITAPEGLRDLAVIHAVGRGRRGGQEAETVVDVLDYYDEATGFRAMERLTGWHASAMLIAQVRGEVRAGAVPQETALPPAAMLAALRDRGIAITIH